MTRRGIMVIVAAACLTGATGRAEDWAQWRGPNRDGKSIETGLMKKWPADGPKKLWTYDGLGAGWSTVSVADGLVYATGYDKEKKVGSVFALNPADGSVTWQTPYGPEYTRTRYRGARSTPTIDNGKLYVCSSVSDIFCLDAKTGKMLWKVPGTEFGARPITWAPAESPLIEGEMVIHTPGGPEATMVALDKNTGKTIWKSTGIGDKQAYCSPIAYTHAGKRQICTVTSDHVIGVDAKTGSCLWKYPYRNRYAAHPNTPIYKDGCIHATAGYDYKSVCLQLSDDGASVKEKWVDETLDTHHGNVIELDGYLYGSSWKGNGDGRWVCLEMKTGKVMWEHEWENKGSLTCADGLFYLLEEKNGTVGLVKPSPKSFQLISSFKMPKQRGPYWAHPVVANGVLYLRHESNLYAYDVKAK